MSQISKKSIVQEVIDTARERFDRFTRKNEIHLDGKDFHKFVKKINLRESDGSAFKGIAFGYIIYTSHACGCVVTIRNRDAVPNYANREQY